MHSRFVLLIKLLALLAYIFQVNHRNGQKKSNVCFLYVYPILGIRLCISIAYAHDSIVLLSNLNLRILVYIKNMYSLGNSSQNVKELVKKLKKLQKIHYKFPHTILYHTILEYHIPCVFLRCLFCVKSRTSH